MSKETYWLRVEKESHYFGAAHMTVYPDGSKESLHGHNYIISLDVELRQAAAREIIPFAEFEKPLDEICRQLDEKLILAKNSPFLEIKVQSHQEIEFLLCKKRYVMPLEDVAFLPIETTSVEALTEHLCRRLLEKLDSGMVARGIASLRLNLTETPGRGASYHWVC